MCRAQLMSGNVKVNRQAFNRGTKFATTRRIVSSNAAVPGKSDAVCPSSPRPRRIRSCVKGFSTLAGHEIELLFVLPRRDLRINFATHAENRFFWNGSGRQKSFPGHSEVALLIVGWNAAFVSKRNASQVPRQIVRDR